MEVIEQSLQGIKLLRPKVFHDERGFFKESYRKSLYESVGIDCEFVQDNHSFSKKGTIRGMHFQRRPGQAKLVSVLEGEIFDVIVDIRSNSATFGKWEGVHLCSKHHDQLFVPVGFAHGFCVLSNTAHVLYKVSTVYDPLEERGFCFDDPDIGIQWPVSDPLVSLRDKEAPSFKEALK